MEPSRILIITDLLDAHADRLITLLRERGEEPVRLNSSDVSARSSLSWSLHPDGDWAGTIVLHGSGRIIDLAALTTVWWRKPSAFGLHPDLHGQQREFAIEETEHTVRGALDGLDCYWVSHPEHIRRAAYKIEQLRRAARLGFEVPRTLVSTEPDAVRAFWDTCDGQVVYKVLTDPYLAAGRHVEQEWETPPPARFVETTLLTPDHLARLGSLRAAPGQFQQCLPKRSELRVTVIGDEVFAAEILSQEHPETMVDFRRFDIPVTYRPARLPDELAARCLALTRGYGLNFSAIDLVLTPDGRYVFLEINPNGQFLFVQQRVPELRMGEAMADCLIRGANS